MNIGPARDWRCELFVEEVNEDGDGEEMGRRSRTGMD